MTELIALLAGVVTDFIAGFGYWGIAVAMALESACIPIPSEVILPFGGYLVARGDLTFWGVVMAGTVGGTIGSIAAYLVGLYGGRPFLARYGRYVFLSQEHLATADRWFARYGQATVFFTRLMPVVRTFISLPAGITRMPFGRFVVYTFLGSLPWSWLLTWVGARLGERWETLGALFHRLDLVIVAALAVMVAYLFLRRRKGHR